MKLILLSLAALVCIDAAAQRVKRKGTTPHPLKASNSSINNNGITYNLEQVQGKWQETSRQLAVGKAALSFTDTLMISINGQKAEVKEGMSMNMRGEAAIDENSLQVAGDSYKIVSLEKETMVLGSDEHIITLKKVNLFYLETVGKDSVKQIKHIETRPLDLALLTGKWTIYRRDAKPGIINTNTTLVKSIEIMDAAGTSNAKGEIVIFSNNISQKLPCHIAMSDKNMQVTSGDKVWIFDTYRASNNEFVFGNNNEVINYAKKF
ncbi:MAG: hypothetical protein EOP53_01270 [Sphingobacteriales bacterium]|nr:MAG: hypothetical protein EOP53_01270 [Sphingobacteriales bacterium]